MKVLVIGASRGIGYSLCEKFLQEGHDVWGTIRAGDISLEGLNVLKGVEVDNFDQLNKLSSDLPELDIIIHNAGILRSDSLESVNFDEVMTQFQINSLAPLKTCLAFKDRLKKGGTFSIMTSRMGSISDNTSGGQYGYRASKAAANAIGKSLAEDLRSVEKTVLLLHPGYVKTDMTSGNGNISAQESAEGLYKVLTEKTMKETGTFWHTNGEQLPW